MTDKQQFSKTQINKYFKTIQHNVNKLAKIRKCKDREIRQAAIDIHEHLTNKSKLLLDEKNNLESNLKALLTQIIELTNFSIDQLESIEAKYHAYLGKRRKPKTKKPQEPEQQAPEELSGWRKLMKKTTGYSGFRW